MKRKFSTPAAALAASVLLFACGCEKEPIGGWWGGGGGNDKSSGTYEDNSGDKVADAVPYSSLQWKFGGADFSGAVSTGVRISGLNLSENGWDYSFKFDTDMTAWGFDKEHAEILCVFVQKSDGTWVGGKIHWQNSANPSSNFHNVYPEWPGWPDGNKAKNTGYNGWSLAGVPNPCQMALVICEGNGKRRSNVIAGTWHQDEARK